MHIPFLQSAAIVVILNANFRAIVILQLALANLVPIFVNIVMDLTTTNALNVPQVIITMEIIASPVIQTAKSAMELEVLNVITALARII